MARFHVIYDKEGNKSEVPFTAEEESAFDLAHAKFSAESENLEKLNALEEIDLKSIRALREVLAASHPKLAALESEAVELRKGLK
jgi:hypothetical protein